MEWKLFVYIYIYIAQNDERVAKKQLIISDEELKKILVTQSSFN